MKKVLINEAFRLQQLAGIAPINEVFEEDIQLAGDINEEEAGFTKSDFSETLEKLYTGLSQFMDMKKSGKISEEEYQPIFNAVYKVYSRIQAEKDAGGDVNEDMQVNDNPSLGDNIPQKKEIDYDDICNIEFDGVDTSDYPDFSDAYVYSAEWCSTGESLTDDELDSLDPDWVHEALFDRLF